MLLVDICSYESKIICIDCNSYVQDDKIYTMSKMTSHI